MHPWAQGCGLIQAQTKAFDPGMAAILPDLSRRSLLASLGIGGLSLRGPGACMAQPKFEDSPFTLGVAAGDPFPDGFVIWTRLAPDPLTPGSGLPDAAIPVTWEVASDDSFREVIRRGDAIADAALGHSVHVEVSGLSSGRPYFYRFTSGGARSLTGRAKTAPVAGASLRHLRLGVAGCQKYSDGFYTAHRRLAEEDVDFVFLYGDYIYENRTGIETEADPSENSPQDIGRVHLGGECRTLDQYRQRYGQYTMDADLQASRAAAAWFVVYDDHEVDNNWVGAGARETTRAGLARRAAAMQAFYEFMPLRRSAFPRGSAMPLYRRAQYGDLLDLNLLDTRQYRTDQPCDDKRGTYCAGVDSPEAQVLGQAQEAWLFDALGRSTARWKVLAQQVMMMDLDRDFGPGYGVNTDGWAGYRIPRGRVLGHIRDRGIGNVVVLTGDEHRNVAGGLWMDSRNPEGPPLATEIVGTSITSAGDGRDLSRRNRDLLAANPGVKFINGQRGYVICDVTPERWQVEFKVLDRVSVRGGTLSTRMKLAIAAGDPRLVAA